VIPGYLGGCLTQALRPSCQWMAAKFRGRDGQIAEVRARLRIPLDIEPPQQGEAKVQLNLIQPGFGFVIDAARGIRECPEFFSTERFEEIT
jgi:hypothetical protein